LARQSPQVVEIDYSYNETAFEVEVLKLSDGEHLQAYSLMSLIAEKFRALLQQPSRDRNRRQDAYDLALLLRHTQNWSESDKNTLRDRLVQSARSRGIQAQHDSMQDPRIKAMSAKGYAEMHDEIDGPLPPFDKIYQLVQDFYEGLPW
jgi:hypothetical protein